MKITLIGAGGARAPLLVRALARSDLGVTSIALYDTDEDRLAIMARVAEAYAPGLTLERCGDAAEAVEGAGFVLASIRAGGMELRARDEERARRLGFLGQETVGPAGFALALRNIPPMIGYARLVERHAPNAWLVNYTNPVGIVCQAVARETGARVVGVCDTPTELFASVAAALDTSTGRLRFDYVGLNHLGWLREVYRDDEPLMSRMLRDDATVRRLYRAPLFEPEWLRALGLLPTEYLYFYYRTREAVAQIARAPRTRGRTLLERNDALYRSLAEATEPTKLYEVYLGERDRTYFSVETGGRSEEQPHVQAATGYDKIALAVLRAIHHDAAETIPVNVVNDETIETLESTDVIEVPARIDARGVHTTKTTVPDAARQLLLQVKDYERLTVLAALTADPDISRRALAANPLVGSESRASAWLEPN